MRFLQRLFLAFLCCGRLGMLVGCASLPFSIFSLTASPATLNMMAGTAGQTLAAAPPSDFSLAIKPTSLTLTSGATGQPVTVSVTAINGFYGKVVVAFRGLPNGVMANPSTLTLTPGISQNITLTAATDAAAEKITATFMGTAGRLRHNSTLAFTIAAAVPPPVVNDVTTYHYDNARDGLNTHETTLTLANVNSAGFGRVGFYGVDGKVDGEPLYLSAMVVNGTTHNILYVVTEHDSVYALDADNGTQIWKKSVLGTSETTSDDHQCGQITPEIGITSTPVIDRHHGTNGAIFVVGMTKDANGDYHQRLHALDLTTGAELSGGPTEIQATYPGIGAFSQNGVQVFEPGQYAERVGLLLMNGIIYMGWTSHCDQHPYTGWLMAYSESTLRQTAVLNLTPNSGGSGFDEGEGSIWMSGAGLAGDASGNIYFLDANGGFDTTLNASGFPSKGDYGNSFMKVSTANGKLAVADYFATSNTVNESQGDADLGSGGTLLLPNFTDANGQVHHLAVGAGKDTNIYVVDRDNMGKFHPANNAAIYQEVTHAIASGVWSMPAYFNKTVYYGGQGDVLKAFTITDAKLGATPASTSSASFGYPGTTPSISANGTDNGIVWAIENVQGNGVLRAYDATNLDHEIYDSTQASNDRDSFIDNKFITPMIVNGKVYVGTPTGVAVFGLLP
jgi:hypothetical protein